ncbi:hypothetical protein CMI46_01020 [Candidatus Pacearchaeota archaeon]|nr:hypothetical protein [Candidatus Pacearchaeota archaeon]|tara:strand:+ start:106 stop:444 length:339 start_codon:yes stop_codon:yes gene_type:complete
MEYHKIKKTPKEHRKEVILSVRTTKNHSEWMKKNEISPTLLFNEALTELKEKIQKNVKRDECVVCKKPSKRIDMGLGMETFSFCDQNCMDIYTAKDPKGDTLEVKGTRIYVK